MAFAGSSTKRLARILLTLKMVMMVRHGSKEDSLRLRLRSRSHQHVAAQVEKQFLANSQFSPAT